MVERIDGSSPFLIDEHQTIGDVMKKKESKNLLRELTKKIDVEQEKMYAALLLLEAPPTLQDVSKENYLLDDALIPVASRVGNPPFWGGFPSRRPRGAGSLSIRFSCPSQAMDAGGKDSTIQKVFRYVNVHGVSVKGFKRPTSIEMAHTFLWRHSNAEPERGKLLVSNRSYYEEVLVQKVHPEFVTDYSHLPPGVIGDMESLWKNRYQDIVNRERHLYNNGFRTIKIFLHLGKDAQKERLLDRLNEAEKHWKFDPSDLKERALWSKYQKAYEEAINATATPHSPWYCVPADDKPTMRVEVARIVLKEIQKLGCQFPSLDEAAYVKLQSYRDQLESE